MRPMYQTVLSNAAPEGARAGTGASTPKTWVTILNTSGAPGTTNASTDDAHGATNLEFRDDLQVMTSNVCYGVPGRVL